VVSVIIPAGTSSPVVRKSVRDAAIRLIPVGGVSEPDDCARQATPMLPGRARTAASLCGQLRICRDPSIIILGWLSPGYCDPEDQIVEYLLYTARNQAPTRVIWVFGQGGKTPPISWGLADSEVGAKFDEHGTLSDPESF
jgi:hypothetical protein